MKPELEIKMVWENLALVMAFWTGVKKGLITRAHLPTGRAVVPSADGFVVDVVNPLELDTDQDLARCVNNHVRGAVAFSAVQAHRTLTQAYRNPPIHEADPDLRAARCAIYVMNHSLSQGMLVPVWDCPVAYRNRFEVRPISFVLDASAHVGNKVNWEDFGGLDKFLDLLQYCGRQLDQAESREANGRSTNGQILLPQENQLSMSFLDNGPVAEFVDAKCLVDLEARAMAKDLYIEYLDWCRDIDKAPLVQRNFGLQLTRLGFVRKRRGRGRHWWQGVEPVGSV